MLLIKMIMKRMKKMKSRTVVMSLHARMSKLMRRYAPMRPLQRRLLSMIEELEKQNGVDLDVVKPRAYKKKKALLGATLGTAGASALGVAAASLVLL